MPSARDRHAPAPEELPASVRRAWSGLLRPTSAAAVFDTAAVRGLPEPARRWLTHAIAPGTPLRTCAELSLSGQLRVHSWRDFHARQVLVPGEGYIWAVRTQFLGMPLVGYDMLTPAGGDMSHRLFGRIPVVASGGADYVRSAAARLAAEVVWVPAAALDAGVTWSGAEGATGDEVTLRVSYGGGSYDVTLTVGPTGALECVSVPRWAKVGRGPWREHRFVALLSGEVTAGGYTVPARAVAGYARTGDAGTVVPFIRQAVDAVRHH